MTGIWLGYALAWLVSAFTLAGYRRWMRPFLGVDLRRLAALSIAIIGFALFM